VSGLYLSIVDMANGQGAGGLANNAGNQTMGVVFAATQASHFCTGGRFIWMGGATSIKVSLWDSTGSRVATVTISVAAAGTYTATFASAVALTAGEAYCISFWDTSAGHYSSFNGASSGAGHPGDFLPQVASIGGPFFEFLFSAAFAGSGTGSIFGVFAAGDNLPTSAGSTAWSTIEPMGS
jgi:hypothetical protein